MEENKLAEQAQNLAMQQGDPAAEKFDTLDYVKEIFLNSVELKKLAEERSKADRKKIRLMRLCVVLMAVVALTLVFAVYAAGPYVRSIVSNFNAITQKVLEIDSKSLVANAQVLIADATTTIKSAGETLDKLDIDALNTAINDLGEKVGKMDMESLNGAIKSLNDVVSTLANTWPFNRG